MIAHSEVYRGILLVVREGDGVSSMGEPMPDRCAYWNVYKTKDELVAEASGLMTVEQRVAVCKAAIDRMVENLPVWTGPWWQWDATS